MNSVEVERQVIVARISVLSFVKEILSDSTPETALASLKKLADLMNRAIDHEVELLGSSTDYSFLFPIGNAKGSTKGKKETPT